MDSKRPRPSPPTLRELSLGTLSALPDHFISLQLLYLDQADISTLACCSRLLRVICQEEPLWMFMCLREHRGGRIVFEVRWRWVAELGTFIIRRELLKHAQRVSQSGNSRASSQPGILLSSRASSQPGIQLSSRTGVLKAPAPVSCIQAPNGDLGVPCAPGSCTQAPTGDLGGLGPPGSYTQPPTGDLGGPEGPVCATCPPKKPHPPSEAQIQAATRPPPPVSGYHSEFLYKRWFRSHMDISTFFPPTYVALSAPSVLAADGSTMSPQKFAEQYDQLCLPVVLTGMTQEWPAMKKWLFRELVSEHASTFFKVSKPGGGTGLMKLADYVDYMQHDEEPLYIFDGDYGQRSAACKLLNDYTVPHVFNEDLFQWMGDSRPSFRWVVAGPARSGASWHVDPSLTSAWNALVSGKKRWALYPPLDLPPGIRVYPTIPTPYRPLDFIQHPDYSYFQVYPTIPTPYRPLEFIQHPGEVVFVPGGWWHCVLNLEASVAVTHNFVSPANLARVVRHGGFGSAHYYANVPLYYDLEALRPGWEAAMKINQEKMGGRQLPALPKEAARLEVISTRSTKSTRSTECGSSIFQELHARLVDTGNKGPDNSQDDNSQDPHPGSGCGHERAWEEAGPLPVHVVHRNMPLSSWLHQMWKARPDLRSQIHSCCKESLAAGCWADLAALMRQAHDSLARPAPLSHAHNSLAHPALTGRAHVSLAQAAWQPTSSTDESELECLPAVGSVSIVFLLNGQGRASTAAKLFTHEVPGPRAVAPHDPVLCRLMCACEATLPQLLLSSSASSQLLSGYTLPNVLSSGVLTVTAATAMASETSAELVASNGSAASETKTTSSPHGKGPIGPENETAKGSSETSPPPSHTGCGASLETSADEAPPALAERSQAACEYPFVLLTQMKDQMSGCQNLREASPLLSASSHMEVARQLGDLVGRLHLAGRAAAALLDPAGLRPGSRANAAAALLDPAGLRPGSHANAEWTRPGSQAGSIHASGPRGHAPQPLENGGKKWVPPPASPPHRGHAPWPLETGDEKRVPLPASPTACPPESLSLADWEDLIRSGEGEVDPCPSLVMLKPDLRTASLAAVQPPWLIHADLSAGNDSAGMLEGKVLGVLDFADAGHGDPLYDLVAIAFSLNIMATAGRDSSQWGQGGLNSQGGQGGLNSQGGQGSLNRQPPRFSQLLSSFWSAYSRVVDVQCMWPVHPKVPAAVVSALQKQPPSARLGEASVASSSGGSRPQGMGEGGEKLEVLPGMGEAGGKLEALPLSYRALCYMLMHEDAISTLMDVLKDEDAWLKCGESALKCGDSTPKFELSASGGALVAEVCRDAH
eukprot:gene12076-15187_t